MLAYVFWHRPAPDADIDAYERGMLAFHATLRASPPPGFVDSLTFARAEQPWMDGYEDWYLVEDWTSLGTLNRGAVDETHKGHHDDVAFKAAAGKAAVLELKRGDADLGAVAAARWSGKPAPEDGTLWQRQMVLGPCPEFVAHYDAARPGAVERRPLR